MLQKVKAVVILHMSPTLHMEGFSSFSFVSDNTLRVSPGSVYPGLLAQILIAFWQ